MLSSEFLGFFVCLEVVSGICQNARTSVNEKNVTTEAMSLVSLFKEMSEESWCRSRRESCAPICPMVGPSILVSATTRRTSRVTVAPKKRDVVLRTVFSEMSSCTKKNWVGRFGEAKNGYTNALTSK